MKCGRVKNPCKICFQSVSNKNGLRCEGACKKWAHYKCLNYTPGKISDIKAGLIKISCPCPNCATSEPKEILTNPPFTCTSKECPATKLPSCESVDCPSKKKPIPEFQPPAQTNPPQPLKASPTECIPPAMKIAPECLPEPEVPTTCKSSPRNIPSPTRIPSPINIRICPQKRPTTSPKRAVSPPRTATSPPRRATSPPTRATSPPRRAFFSPGRPVPSNKKASKDKTFTSKPCQTSPKHCLQSSKQTNDSDKLCSPQRSQSCSFDRAKPGDLGTPRVDPRRVCSSDFGLSNARNDEDMVFRTIEEMCNTVGHLSDQLKNLMYKMKSALENNKR